jgi:cell division cycle 20-like protein 1 (cofactor of APC complex)
LKLNPSADIIATGGNDNKLVLFSLKKMGKMVSWDQHEAAVKAIGFNPS